MPRTDLTKQIYLPIDFDPHTQVWHPRHPADNPAPCRSRYIRNFDPATPKLTPTDDPGKPTYYASPLAPFALVSIRPQDLHLFPDAVPPGLVPYWIRLHFWVEDKWPRQPQYVVHHVEVRLLAHPDYPFSLDAQKCAVKRILWSLLFRGLARSKVVRLGRKYHLPMPYLPEKT